MQNWEEEMELQTGQHAELAPVLKIGGTATEVNHAIVRTATADNLIQEGATTPGILNQYAGIGVKFETPAQAGIHGDLVNVGHLNFNPRVGFAYNWRLGRRSVVVRGGFGEYHYNLGGRMWVAQRSIPPLSGTVSYNASSAATSPDGLANYALDRKSVV
jgi:hypothetical protein